MQIQDMKKLKKKLAIKLIGEALSGFYYFENDDVENFIDRLDLKFKDRPDKHKLIRSALVSHPKLYPIVVDVAYNMWGNSHV